MENEQVILRDVMASSESLLGSLPHDTLRRVATLVVGNVMQQFTRSQFGEHSLVEVVGSLFEGHTRAEVIEMARQIALTELKNFLCLECTWWKAGLHNVAQLVQCRNAERLHELHRQRQPAILGFWHLGPRFAVGPALERAGVPALLLAKIPASLRDSEAPQSNSENGVEYFQLADSPASGAVALKRAVEQLQKGGLVVVAIDGLQGEKKVEVPFLNRRLSVGRGPAVLSRLTGAPIIPAVCSWAAADWKIDFQVYDPLPLPQLAQQANLVDEALAGRSAKPAGPSQPARPTPAESNAFDEAVMKTAIGWFDTYVRSNPGQLRLHRLRALLAAPLLKTKGAPPRPAGPST